MATNCVTVLSVATAFRKRLNREGIGTLLMLRMLVYSFALANGALMLSQVHLFVKSLENSFIALVHLFTHHDKSNDENEKTSHYF